MKVYKLKKYLINILSAKIKTPIHFMSLDSNSASVIIEMPTKIAVSTTLPEEKDVLSLVGESKNYIAHFSLTINIERSVEGRKVTRIFPAGVSKCCAEDAYTFEFEKEFLANILESGLDMMVETFKSIEPEFMKELGKAW